MLREGDTAPEFTLHDQSGQPVTLSRELETGPVVVFFYPRAMTRGCTAESSETNMDTHADRALHALQARAADT